MTKHKITDREEKFDKRYGKLFKAFMEVEAREFSDDRKRKFIIEETSEKVKQFILDNCFRYVKIETLANVGLLSCSLTLDMFANDVPDHAYKGDVTIILCTCGTNFSAQDKDYKMMYASKCHEEYGKWRKSHLKV